jgi:hypothetical protein
MLKRAWAWLIAYFWPPPPAPVEKPRPIVLLPAPNPPEPPPVTEKRKRAPSRKADDAAFKAEILDKLEFYMVYIRRMRRSDPEAYHLYRQIGAVITAKFKYTEEEADAELSPWWLQTMPGFGACGVGLGKNSEQYEEKSKSVVIKFVWYTRYKNPPATVQRMQGEGSMYRVSVYWDKPALHKKTGRVTEYPVWVHPNGKVTVLRVRCTKTNRIQHRKGHSRGRVTVIEMSKWGIPFFFHDWGRQNDMTAEAIMRLTFLNAARAIETTQTSMIRVSASKGAETAVFAVDTLQTPNFFSDREPIIDADGKTKRIFHIARTHPRTRENGHVTPIKTHFRGLRNFTWNGYQIAITVPGRDHLDIAEFPLESIDESERVPGHETIAQPELGRRFAEHIRTGDPNAIAGKGRNLETEVRRYQAL